MLSEPDRDMEKSVATKDAANGGDRVAEGRLGFVVPSRGMGRTAVLGVCIKPCAQTVTSEYSPSSAGVVRRIARSDHCRCVSTPRCSRTSWKVVSIRQRKHEAPEDRRGFKVEVGAKKRLRVTLAGGIAHQDPADRGRRQAAMVPDRGAGDILQLAGLTAVPFGQHDGCPYSFGIGQHGVEFGQAFAFQRGPAALALPAFGGGLEQAGVQTQAGDQADVMAHGGDQLQCGETAVGDDDDRRSANQRLVCKIA